MARPTPAIKDAAAVKAVTKTLVGTIGSMIDELHDLREKKREKEAELATIQAEYDALEETLMAKLEAEATDKGSGKRASVSITEQIVGTLTDFEAFSKFIKRTGYTHLFQRRLSDPALRELWESGKTIPGVAKFTRKRLNLRSN